jgi:hypothetical protein
MSILLLTRTDESGCVTPRRTRAADRLRARLCAWQLDQALAEGRCPDATAALSLRAAALISDRTRRQLSAEIQRVLRHARRPASPHDRSPTRWQRPNTDAILLFQDLADHLDNGDPVDATGVARVRILLRDGTGPLYDPYDPDSLNASLQAAMEALDPRVRSPDATR